jgi:DNA repair ATPase RecN
MDTAKLVVLKEQIENLDAFHHNKILKIMVKNNIKYSENRNGIFVNMNSFDNNTIKEIEESLLYIKNQEKNLQDIETIKEEINKDYFENDNKDKNTVILSHGSA